ncbi:MAG: circularly permuted type 2 ATP-grasp protein [Xanthomonadales bacterium]|nr:circularly permuted type 2 ATP-grasp protein [Xanthomonadales bacterium]
MRRKPALDYAKSTSIVWSSTFQPTRPSAKRRPVFVSALKGVARAEMLRRIEARPHAYVAREMIELSQAPTWSRAHERRLLSPVGLRSCGRAVVWPDGASA